VLNTVPHGTPAAPLPPPAPCSYKLQPQEDREHRLAAERASAGGGAASGDTAGAAPPRPPLRGLYKVKDWPPEAAFHERLGRHFQVRRPWPECALASASATS
jgi:hypothetical protein